MQLKKKVKEKQKVQAGLFLGQLRPLLAAVSFNRRGNGVLKYR
jgi:hypothetical protein